MRGTADYAGQLAWAVLSFYRRPRTVGQSLSEVPVCPSKGKCLGDGNASASVPAGSGAGAEALRDQGQSLGFGQVQPCLRLQSPARTMFQACETLGRSDARIGWSAGPSNSLSDRDPSMPIRQNSLQQKSLSALHQHGSHGWRYMAISPRSGTCTLLEYVALRSLRAKVTRTGLGHLCRTCRRKLTAVLGDQQDGGRYLCRGPFMPVAGQCGLSTSGQSNRDGKRGEGQKRS